MTTRRKMRMSDWGNSAVNLVIGLILGLVAEDFARLLLSDSWPVAIFIVLLFWGVLLFDRVLERVSEWIFGAGVTRVLPRHNVPRKPYIRVLSLPAGFLLGMVLFRLGLRASIMGLF